MLRSALLLFVVCSVCLSLAAPTDLALGSLPSPPLIDGIVDDASEWLGAASGEGALDVVTKAPAPENMRFWIAADENYLYFAARMQDSQPQSIIAQETRKNVNLSGNDTVTLVVDVLGTLTDFNSFTMNPAGANSIGIAGGRAAKAEWLGEIVTQGRITEQGWEAEARIPWRIMRLPDAGARTIRFNVRRYIPRLQRDVTWTLTDAQNISNIGRLSGVVIPKVDSERVIQLLPYAYVGQNEDKLIFNSGLDFRTKLDDRIELVGAVNPDFRNIENQILSLDFSYFERLASDARPFFAEGGSFFNTGYDSRLFASQRVPSFDVGAKVFGKIDDRNQFGVMNLNTLDKENAFVATFRHSPGARGTIEGAVSSLRRDGIENDGSFVNVSQGIGPNLYYANLMNTYDKEFGTGSRFTTGFFSEVPGRNLWFDAVSIDANFVPRLGFNSERDVKGFAGGYGQFKTYQAGPIMDTEWGVDAGTYWRQNGDRYRNRVTAYGSIAWKNGFDLDLSARKSTFEEFDDERYSFSLEWPRRDRYRNYEYNHTFGHLRGKRFVSHGVSLAFQPTRALQIAGSAQFVQHFEDATQIILSASWELPKDRAVSGRLVRRNSDLNAYVSFRQSGGRGNEYFLILGDPNANRFRSSLILKFVSPLDIRI